MEKVYEDIWQAKVAVTNDIFKGVFKAEKQWAKTDKRELVKKFIQYLLKNDFKIVYNEKGDKPNREAGMILRRIASTPDENIVFVHSFKIWKNKKDQKICLETEKDIIFKSQENPEEVLNFENKKYVGFPVR